MTDGQLRELVISVVREIQVMSGRPTPEFNDDMYPIGGCVGFDSINAAEAESILSERLNSDIGFNPFISSDGKRKLRLGEVVKRIAKASAVKEGRG